MPFTTNTVGKFPLNFFIWFFFFVCRVLIFFILLILGYFIIILTLILFTVWLLQAIIFVFVSSMLQYPLLSIISWFIPNFIWKLEFVLIRFSFIFVVLIALYVVNLVVRSYVGSGWCCLSKINFFISKFQYGIWQW